MKLRVFNELSPELEKIWRGLENHSDVTPFQSYEWLSHWYTVIGLPINNLQLVVVTVINKGETEALLPLCVSENIGIKKLEWLGGVNSDYLLPIIKRNSLFIQENFTFIWEELLSLVNYVDLVSLSKQTEFLGKTINPFVSELPNRFLMNSHQAFLEVPWEEYLKQNISKKVLSDSRRQRRRLLELGNLEFVIGKSTKEGQVITSEMLKQKEARYIEKDGWNMFKITEYKDLYRSLHSDLGPLGDVHLSCLKLNDQIIATHWGFVSKEKFYYIMPTHEGSEWSRYSPGKLLLEDLMKWCYQNGIKIFDFTGGDEPYKKIWANKSSELSEAIIPLTVKGKLYLAFKRFKLSVKETPIIGNLGRKIFNILRKS